MIQEIRIQEITSKLQPEFLSQCRTPDLTIDYRCDNEKITLALGRHLGIIA